MCAIRVLFEVRNGYVHVQLVHDQLKFQREILTILVYSYDFQTILQFNPLYAIQSWRYFY